MRKTKVLVADDEIAIQKFIRANLEAREYQVILAKDGAEAIKVLEIELPDLIILDIMMPNMDGFEVCRRVREWSKIPIIMLSARNNEADKVLCLNSGADDYLSKPFSINELMARINAVLRRTQVDETVPSRSIFRLEGLTVDFASQTVSLNGESVDLTAIEYRMLSYLALNASRIVTNDQILEKVWGEDYIGEDHLVQVNICRLRQKLYDTGRSHKYIVTKSGIGYMMPKENRNIPVAAFSHNPNL